MLRFFRRTLLAAVYVGSSIGVLQNAEHLTAPAEALGLPEPVKMVQLHGTVNLVGGLMLMLNIKPKLAAWALIGNLIPTTLGAHRFWEHDDEGAKMNDMSHFMKNMSLLGGLLTVLATERRAEAA